VQTTTAAAHERGRYSGADFCRQTAESIVTQERNSVCKKVAFPFNIGSAVGEERAEEYGSSVLDSPNIGTLYLSVIRHMPIFSLLCTQPCFIKLC